MESPKLALLKVAEWMDQVWWGRKGFNRAGMLKEDALLQVGMVTNVLRFWVECKLAMMDEHVVSQGWTE